MKIINSSIFQFILLCRVKRSLILYLFTIVPFLNGFSQTSLCSEYEADQRAEQENPEALNAKAILEAFTMQFNQNYKKTETTYIIPVVFHVLHNYGSENISKAQILDAVRILNEDYKKLNSDTSDILSAFAGIAANSHIEFRLAQIDPNGNCTDGIVRVVTNSTYNADDDSKAQSPAWPRNKYLNIWTCSSIGSGAAGYAYYPSSVAGSWGTGVDGVLILSSYVGSIGTGSYLTSRALTHEIGHCLNLAHTWGDSNQPGVASNCGIDDGVTDTPNTIGHTSCDLYANTCGVLDNVQNYMEYSYCSRMYTEGQSTRMAATLNSSISGRNNLWSASNLIATGTNDAYIAQVCVPVPDFTFNKSQGCENVSVQYYSQVWNVDSLYTLQWSFPGASPSVSSDENPIVTYSTPGVYSTTLTASTSGGSNQITRSNIIQVLDPTIGEALPWTESFENSAFPLNPTDAAKDWTIKGNSDYNWSWNASAAYTGSSSVQVLNANNISGQKSELYSPNIIFAGSVPDTYLTFHIAYAQKTASDNDKLQVYFSNNCGETWTLRYTRIGAALTTNGGTLVSSFSPDTSQWRKESLILISSFISQPNFRVKFVVTSGDGNSLYLDDINIETADNTGIIPLSVSNNLSFYPNPITSESFLSFDLNEASNVSISLFNVFGQKIAFYNDNYSSGSYDLSLEKIFNTELPTGVYFLSMSIGGKQGTLKLIKE